jgi:hypothetical protein
VSRECFLSPPLFYPDPIAVQTLQAESMIPFLFKQATNGYSESALLQGFINPKSKI